MSCAGGIGWDRRRWITLFGDRIEWRQVPDGEILGVLRLTAHTTSVTLARWEPGIDAHYIAGPDLVLTLYGTQMATAGLLT